MNIRPTVGRVVLFVAAAGDTLFRQAFSGEALAAQIAHVHEDGSINVSVLDRDGNAHARQRVHLVQPDDTFKPEDQSYCEWMPYQKGQAPASDQVQSKLTELEERAGEMEARINGADDTLGLVQSSVSSLSSRVHELEQKGAQSANSAAPA